MIRQGSSSKRYMVTYVLIAINVVVYAYTAFLSQNALTINEQVVATYGQFNARIIYNGWYWQLFTSMFVHLDITHIAGNMIFLLIFGLRAEDVFSLPEYLFAYLFGGFVGNVLTLVVYGPIFISAGASGAIFGLFGAVTIYINRVLRQSIVGGLMFAFLLLILNVGAGINILAHLGGLVVGLLVGSGLAASRKPRIEYRYRYSA